MLILTLPDREFYDEKTNRFIDIKGGILRLEHSLYSIAKWESKWKKPFLDNKEKTKEQTYDYIKCMAVDDIEDSLLDGLTDNDIITIQKYLEDSQTATWFSDTRPNRPSREIITAEIIYYWMIAQNVPMECQYWHFSRLITLLKVCNIKNAPKDSNKMSAAEVARRNRSINAARRKQMGTKG